MWDDTGQAPHRKRHQAFPNSKGTGLVAVWGSFILLLRRAFVNERSEVHEMHEFNERSLA